MTALWTGMALGLDNFAVALALGTLALPRAHRFAVAAAFGVCEALGVLLGAVLGAALDLDRSAALIAGLALTATAAIVLGGVRAAHWQARVRGPWLVVGLPLCLALDNVVAGAGLGWSASLAAGAASAAVAVAGLELGAGAARLLPRLAVPGAAALLCAFGLHALAAM